MYDTHVARVHRWKSLNPDHNVIVWVNDESELRVKKQFENSYIQVKNISLLAIPDAHTTFIKKLIEPREDALPANYAAASDILRIFCLYNSEDFSWYVDTDIDPREVKSIIIHPSLDFHIEGRNFKDISFQCAGSVIGSMPKSALIMSAISFLKNLAGLINDEDIVKIRNKLAVIRGVATENSTGAVISESLKKLSLDNKPFIIHSNKIARMNESLIASHFSLEREFSWLLKLNSNPNECLPINGIEIDHHFNDYIFKGKISFAELQIQDLLKKKAKAYQLMQNRNISTDNNDVSLNLKAYKPCTRADIYSDQISTQAYDANSRKKPSL